MPRPFLIKAIQKDLKVVDHFRGKNLTEKKKRSQGFGVVNAQARPSRRMGLFSVPYRLILEAPRSVNKISWFEKTPFFYQRLSLMDLLPEVRTGDCV